MRISLNAADRLSLLFIALLGSITLVFMPAGWGLPGAYVLLALALLAAAWFRTVNAGKTGFYVHVAFTVVLVLVLFNSLGGIIAEVRPIRYDDLLIRIDYALFGVHPTVWMERLIHPWLTALFQLAYISYYFMPVALGVTLIAGGRWEAFERALFGIVLCFYLSYLGYLLVPAVGPRFTLEHLQTTGLQAGAMTSALQETLNRLEYNKTDAFPSGHTAIALVSLYYAWKLRERYLSRILLPLVLALIVSTVYLRYHYVIDVIAGVALACLTVVAAPLLIRRFSSRPAGHPGNEIHHAS